MVMRDAAFVGHHRNQQADAVALQRPMDLRNHCGALGHVARRAFVRRQFFCQEQPIWTALANLRAQVVQQQPVGCAGCICCHARLRRTGQCVSDALHGLSIEKTRLGHGAAPQRQPTRAHGM